MTITDWFKDLPPASMTDSGLKMLIYLIIVFFILSAIAVAISTKVYKKRVLPTLLDMELETDRPVPSDIPPAERIAILKIEKAKFLGAQRALSDAHKRKEIGESIFTRLSVRYTSDVKKIEDEIEKTAREAEVSQLEQELKKMQGDYLSKIKGETIETTAPTPITAPPAPPTKPVKEKKVKKEKRGKKAVAVAPLAPPSPPMPPAIGKTPPPTAIPSPPMPTAPTSGVGTPSIPAPSMPTPKPPGPIASPAPTPEGGEGDLFAKSTSIAALRKEMLKELDRLKKFMSEQQ